jgi:hypothetical protein
MGVLQMLKMRESVAGRHPARVYGVRPRKVDRPVATPLRQALERDATPVAAGCAYTARVPVSLE